MELTIDEKKTLESILKTEIIEVEDLIKMSDESDADELRTYLAKFKSIQNKLNQI